MEKTVFERISLWSAVESFLVFALCGFLAIYLGSFTVDLTKDLPDNYASLIQEPVSLKFFFILTLIGLVLAGLCTLGGSRDLTGRIWFEFGVLAIARAGISCGFIASGMVLGIGVGLYIVSDEGTANAVTAIGFVKLGLFFLSLVYAMSVLLLNLLNRHKRHAFYIDLMGFVYLISLVAGWYYYDRSLNWFGVGCCLALLIFYCFVGRVWLRKPVFRS